MRILVTGANGLLGQKIVNQLINRSQCTFIATARGENRNPSCPSNNYHTLDITNKAQIETVFSSFKPDVVINTAAMTNVDLCEENKEGCDLLNVKAVQFLFEYCEKNSTYFQQLSTDFVFDGEKGNYNEEDKVNPLSYYAKSKVKSEEILQKSSYKRWSIVRTIIILGITPGMSRSNILLWAKGALEKNQPLNIVNDQYRAPTWADDLAWACIEIATKTKEGIYHISGPKTYSILEIVELVGNHYGLDISLLTAVSSSTLNQKASRPPKTGFDISKAIREINYQPKTLKEILVLLENELKQ